MVVDEGAGAIAIEDPMLDKTNTCKEMNDFENVAKSTSVELMGLNVNLNQCSQSTLFSQASHENIDSSDKCLESLADLNLKHSPRKPKITACWIS